MEGGRVNGAIEVARSFGDLAFKKYGVAAIPDLRIRFKVTEHEEFLLLGCDGLWGRYSEANACTFLRTRLWGAPTLLGCRWIGRAEVDLHSAGPLCGALRGGALLASEPARKRERGLLVWVRHACVRPRRPCSAHTHRAPPRAHRGARRSAPPPSLAWRQHASDAARQPTARLLLVGGHHGASASRAPVRRG